MSSHITKLSWAGIRITAGAEQLVIDGLEGRNGEVQGRIGPNRRPLIDLAETSIDVALVTHTHKDHFDADALHRRLTPHKRVLVPADSAAEVRDAGFNAIPITPFAGTAVGAFHITALPAVDGFGAAQVAWLVETPDLRIIHLGDTLFHGFWWQIAKSAGPVDAVFLPINGARVAIPGQPATGLPGVMTAEQAVVAARLLQARLAVPIHYEEFHSPPAYNADLHAEAQFLEHARAQAVPAQVFAPGEIVLTR